MRQRIFYKIKIEANQENRYAKESRAQYPQQDIIMFSHSLGEFFKGMKSGWYTKMGKPGAKVLSTIYLVLF